jgi:competence protein ComEA
VNKHSSVRALASALLLAGLVLGGPAPAQHLDASATLVNVNTATAEELEMLPGIGPSKARAILAARQEKGRFESLDELEGVKGIGLSTVEQLRPYATVSGRTTASPQ